MTKPSQTQLKSPEIINAATQYKIVEHWLSRFETALNLLNHKLLKNIFIGNSHWRDLLAISGKVKTVTGRNDIANELISHAAEKQMSSFMIDPDRMQPRLAKRSGKKVLEALFTFDIPQGTASGILRLALPTKRTDCYKAWTIGTVLEELKGENRRYHVLFLLFFYRELLGVSPICPNPRDE